MAQGTQRIEQRVEHRADLRDPVDRERKQRRGADYDKFAIDPSSIPAGTTYEWKRFEVAGKPDAEHQIMLRADGWEPVDGTKHPELMMPGQTGNVVRGDMILMQRPQYLTDEARAEAHRNAKIQVLENEARLNETPSDTLERQVARISRSHEAARAIPE